MQGVAQRFGVLLGVVVVGAGSGWAGEPLTVPIVYVARAIDASHLPSQDKDGTSVVARASEGRLLVSQPDGFTRALADATAVDAPAWTPLDVSHPDVSYDAARVVFAGYSGVEKTWRIFEVNADGSGLHQVTRSDRVIDLTRYGEAAKRFETYDDTDPCYLPDGRICFVSTRYPGLAPGDRARSTNLYVVQADGSDLHRITTERFGADTPAVDPATGRIVYSRWWLTPREAAIPPGGPTPGRPPAYYGPTTNANNFSPIVLRGIDDAAYEGVNQWSLATVAPDGSGLAMFRGYGLNRQLTMAYRPAFLPGGELIAQFILQSPVLGMPGNNGLRLFHSAGDVPTALGGPQSFFGDAALPDPNPAVETPPFHEPELVYASASGLPDGRLLVSLRPMHGAYYTLYVQDGAASVPVPLFNEGATARLDAVALAPRNLPPVIADRAPHFRFEEAPVSVAEAKAQGGTFTFKAENVFANGPTDFRIANAPPIGRDLTIEFYMNPQRQSVGKPEPPILIDRKEIGPDGKVEMELPAGVPLLEILRLPDGRLGVGRDGQAFHVGGMNYGAAGAVARCVGCHAGHSQLAVPDDASWTNVAPSALVTASSTREISSGSATPFFPPALLVDRLTDPLASEWAATMPQGSGGTVTVQLRWIRPIRARQIVVYGTKPGKGLFGERNQVIRGLTISASLGGNIVEQRAVRATVLPEGTAIDWSPEGELDVLTISVASADVEGIFEGQPGPALSEVEVIGKLAAPDAPSTIAVIHGDANCDGQVNVTDAIVTLNSLFQGAGLLCCEEAADVSQDGRVNLTDPIELLGYLYLGHRVAGVNPYCSSVTGSPLTCEAESCP